MNGDPVWLQVIGPSSSGKTEIANSLSEILDTQIMGDITPQAFISGNKSPSGSPPPGILQKMIHNNESYKMLIFKDASTLISKKYDEISNNGFGVKLL